MFLIIRIIIKKKRFGSNKRISSDPKGNTKHQKSWIPSGDPGVNQIEKTLSEMKNIENEEEKKQLIKGKQIIFKFFKVTLKILKLFSIKFQIFDF